MYQKFLMIQRIQMIHLYQKFQTFLMFQKILRIH
jgi:hypothetical protein